MESKSAKTPPITSRTKLLSFDLEANGLHGEVFAIGAVLMDMSGNILDQFTGRTKIIGEIDPWVTRNVIPTINDMSLTHQTYKDLRESFWHWYITTEPQSDYVLVKNGYPVEYRFLIKCQEENLAGRYWQHPFPILDLTSMLIEAGDEMAKQAAVQATETGNFNKHHPLDDAKLAALTAAKLFKLTGRIVA